MAKRSTSKDYQPDASTRILVAYGSEDFLKKQKIDALRQAVGAEHGECELFQFDGKSATLAEVFDELRGYSLMSTYKLVVVDEAEAFVKQHREALERYAQEPVDHASLVLRSDRWHAGKLDKLIAKVGGVAKCEPLKPAMASAWLIKRAKQVHGRGLDRDAADMLVARVGSSLLALDSEVGKLAVMVGEGETISAALVDEAVGKGSDEAAWSVQEAVLEAIAAGRAGEAVEAIDELRALAGHHEVLLTYFVADLMRKFCLARAMQSEGASGRDIAGALKLWGPRQRLFERAQQQLAPGGAADLLDRILRADRRAKSGLGNSRRNLECFAASMSDRMR